MAAIESFKPRDTSPALQPIKVIIRVCMARASDDALAPFWDQSARRRFVVVLPHPITANTFVAWGIDPDRPTDENQDFVFRAEFPVDKLSDFTVAMLDCENTVIKSDDKITVALASRTQAAVAAPTDVDGGVVVISDPGPGPGHDGPRMRGLVGTLVP